MRATGLYLSFLLFHMGLICWIGFKDQGSAQAGFSGSNQKRQYFAWVIMVLEISTAHVTH